MYKTNIVITISIIVALLFQSCLFSKSYSCNIDDIEKLIIVPELGTYKMKVSISGVFLCPMRLNMVIDGEIVRESSYYSLLLQGQIDTTFSNDWYSETLGFNVSYIEAACDKNDGRVSVVMYH